MVTWPRYQGSTLVIGNTNYDIVAEAAKWANSGGISEGVNSDLALVA